MISKEIFQKMGRSLDPDRGLQWMMDKAISSVQVKRALSSSPETYRAGSPLKLILAGYVGNRNTGADVRVEEMIRQIRKVLGDKNLELTVMTLDKSLTSNYFQSTRQVTLPQVFPKFLFEECPKHHGVIACEGSMFKSKFADALSTMMAGSLGIANVENKLSVGYGAEAGDMSPGLGDFVRRHCRKSFVICRNEPSREILQGLGIRTTSGTDTAWTFEPSPRKVGEQYLRDAGWDGKKPILALAPINPFWWPVKPDIWKGLSNLLSQHHDETHYKSLYFHQYNAEDREQYRSYIRAFASGVNSFLREHDYFPIIIGMERLDRKAGEDLRQKLIKDAPLFISDHYDMYELVSILRVSNLLLSSRFHAIVCSMPGGVVSGGITMDERIHNLLSDRGHKNLLLQVDQDDLEEEVLRVLLEMRKNEEKYRKEISASIPEQLQKMAAMAQAFRDEVLRVYPDFPMPEPGKHWTSLLPDLPKELEEILEMQ